jgi:hypothetical protein
VTAATYETDWLATEPVFYNEVTGKVGTNINDVIDFENLEFDSEGLAAYLDHGYCVFQRSPVRNVRILPPSSRLVRDGTGRLAVEALHDRLDDRLSRRFTEGEIIDLARSRVQAIEARADGDIVIPTSGGCDSRLLNLMVANKSRVRSFTYGPSARQHDSTQVLRAETLSHILGTRWERIPIGAFHLYLDEWDDIFGPAVNAHGVFQLEFYHRVRSRLSGNCVVLSGMCGDWFAGRADPVVPVVQSPRDVAKLIFSHGVHADSKASCAKPKEDLYEQYFEEHRSAMGSQRLRLVEAARFRMMMIHYLVRVPQWLGFRPYAPFADIDVATALLVVPDERRRGREWLQEYFAREGVALRQAGDEGYRIYWQAMRRFPLRPLDEGLLCEVVRPEYVRRINRTIGWRGLWWEGYDLLQHQKGFRRALHQLQRWGLTQRRLESYYAYVTLRPLERLLQRRNLAQSGARG